MGLGSLKYELKDIVVAVQGPIIELPNITDIYKIKHYITKGCHIEEKYVTGFFKKQTAVKPISFPKLWENIKEFFANRKIKTISINGKRENITLEEMPEKLKDYINSEMEYDELTYFLTRLKIANIAIKIEFPWQEKTLSVEIYMMFELQELF